MEDNRAWARRQILMAVSWGGGFLGLEEEHHLAPQLFGLFPGMGVKHGHGKWSSPLHADVILADELPGQTGAAISDDG